MRANLLSKDLVDQRSWHINIFPTYYTFSTSPNSAFLKQTVIGIVTVLTYPSSTITPSLQIEDPVRNSWLTLATQLKRIGNIQDQQEQFALISKLTPETSPIAPVPRVKQVENVRASPPKVK